MPLAGSFRNRSRLPRHLRLRRLQPRPRHRQLHRNNLVVSEIQNPGGAAAVCAGTPIVLSVANSSTFPVRYQWSVNGTPAGAKSKQLHIQCAGCWRKPGCFRSGDRCQRRSAQCATGDAKSDGRNATLHASDDSDGHYRTRRSAARRCRQCHRNGSGRLWRRTQLHMDHFGGTRLLLRRNPRCGPPSIREP